MHVRQTIRYVLSMYLLIINVHFYFIVQFTCRILLKHKHTKRLSAANNLYQEALAALSRSLTLLYIYKHRSCREVAASEFAIQLKISAPFPAPLQLSNSLNKPHYFFYLPSVKTLDGVVK